MEKAKLITSKPKRLFAFGCSCTNLHWVTWPEIVALDLNCDLYNFANPANGNDLIFNSIMQADSYFKFNEDDLVMICWTGITRESRFYKGNWIRTTRRYKDFSKIETEYFDNDNFLLKSVAYQKAVTDLLELRKCQSHQMTMSGFGTEGDYWNPASSKVDIRIPSLYEDYLNKLLPSIYGVLFNYDFSIKEKQEKNIHPKFVDLHPLPIEALTYLQAIYDHDFKQNTIDKTVQFNDGLIQVLKNVDYSKTVKHEGEYVHYEDCNTYKSQHYIAVNLLNNKEFQGMFFI